MDLRQLKYFVTIVEAGTVTEASHRLHIVQSALSQRLADLEESMGVQLLVRSRTGVRVTEAGHELYTRAKLMLKQAQATRSAVQEKASAASGPVGIGLLRSIAPILGAKLFRAIRNELPQIRPEIVVGYSDELLRMLRNGALDLSLGVQQPSDALLDGSFVFAEGVHLVGVRDFVRTAAPVGVEHLRDVPLLVSSGRGPIHRVLEAAAGRHGFALNVVGSLEDQASLMELCSEGLAATYVPETTAAYLVRRHPAMRAAPIQEPLLERNIFMYTHSAVPRTGAVMALERLIVRLLHDERAQESTAGA